MAQNKGKYFNRRRLLKTLVVLAAGALLFVLYMVISVWVLGMDLPKTAVLRRQNADWQSRLEQMGARLDHDEEVISLLEVRDDRIYRSVYGEDEIPAAVRNAGIGGNNRYPALAALDRSHILRQTAQRLDRLGTAATSCGRRPSGWTGWRSGPTCSPSPTTISSPLPRWLVTRPPTSRRFRR